MSKRTLFLIILLIVAVLGLLALSLQKTETPKPQIPVSVAKTTLSLLRPLSATPSGTFTTDVNINTEDQSVTAVQLELSYDPFAITDVDITPGSFIKNPIVLLKNIDEKNGKVSYALGVPLGQKGVSGQGVVATLSFSKNKITGTSTISFDPKTLVSAEGIAQSVLKGATGITLDLSK